ncbi:MAG: SIS domain-containing protein [Lachnospiraceae bacterium]|nr:SIS domain-containing protein [Lachnospiraceae bacterium]
METKYQKLKELYLRYPVLTECKEELEAAMDLIMACFRDNGTLLICGNGGSASDSDHIVGELMKEFCRKRSLPEEMRNKLLKTGGEALAENIRGALPAISLDAHTALITAIINDIGSDYMYAQQVYGYGREGDVLFAISTSGNAKNVDLAVKTAKAMGIRSILFTGRNGGIIKNSADLSVKLPETETYKIQELMLPVFHALCLQAEESFFTL